eukprot:4224758-Pyramimonas_sp.AAC.1
MTPFATLSCYPPGSSPRAHSVTWSPHAHSITWRSAGSEPGGLEHSFHPTEPGGGGAVQRLRALLSAGPLT